MMLDEEFFDVSDEDDNILRYIRHINNRRKDRVVRPRPNHFAIWDENERCLLQDFVYLKVMCLHRVCAIK